MSHPNITPDFTPDDTPAFAPTGTSDHDGTPSDVPAPPTPVGGDLLYRGRTHPKILVRPLLAAIVLIAAHAVLIRYYPNRLGWDLLDQWGEIVLHLILAVLDVKYVVAPTMRWHSSTFEVTNRFIKMKWGVLYKNSREIHLDRITQINEERGILDRMVGCGTIIVYDAANASAIKFHDVANFRRVRTILDDARYQAHARPHLDR